MSKSLFNHLTLIEEIITEIDVHDLSTEEREELVDLVQKTLYHHVLTTVLDHLPQDKHQQFLTQHHHHTNESELLAWLKSEIKIAIEKEIRTQAAKIKKEILAEIKKAKVSRK